MKTIQLSETINGTSKEIWDSWTTNEGIQSFFAPKSDVELAIGGKFEMYFLLENEYGLRGSETCKILSYLPQKMLSFSWNAPPHLPEVRKEKTWVVLEFETINEQQTKVILTNLGYKEGNEWEAALQYFQNAWRSVLTALKTKFDAN